MKREVLISRLKEIFPELTMQGADMFEDDFDGSTYCPEAISWEKFINQLELNGLYIRDY